MSVERSHTAELSFEKKSGRTRTGCSWEAAAYRNAVQNFIHAVNVDSTSAEGLPVYRYTSDNLVLSGAEIGIGYVPARWPNWKIESSLAYVHASKTFEQMPPTRWRTELGWSRAKWGRMEQLYGRISVDCLADYSVVQLSLGARFSERLTLGIGAHNLLNTTYIPVLSLLKNLGIAEPGRNISLRLVLSL